MTGRYRLVALAVTPIIVWDDGEDLHDLPAQPFKVAAVDIDGLGERLRGELAAMPAPEAGGD